MSARLASPPKISRRRGRPPGSNSQATRERILHAAWECFARKGYAGTTNRDIADRAKITSAAIYQYFDSKSDLYVAAVRAAQRELLPDLRAAIQDAPTARAALRGLAQMYATMHQRNSSIAPFLSALPVEMQRHDEIAKTMMGERSDVLSMIISAVERGVKTGEIPAARGPGAVAMFVACTMGLSMYASLIAPEGVIAAVDAYVRLIDGTLLATPRAAPKDGKRKREDISSASRTRSLVRGVQGVIRVNPKK
jgi:TetR/AcrR family transcriptional regulator, transcriptional repressor for nem operon